MRPFPSLRIIFVSPALRIPGLLQSPFLSRIGGPSHVRHGLSEAFESGESVTAKVTWLPQGRSDDNDYARPGSSNGRGPDGGKTRYISCTPLLGSDDQVGVWMVVMVENEQVTGRLPSRAGPHRERLGAERAGEIPNTSSEYEREDSSVRNFVDGRRERENQRPHREATVNGNGAGPGYGYGSNSRSQPPQLDGEAGRAYTEFLRSQQQPNGSQNQTPNQNAYSHRINEGHYHQSPQPGQTRGQQQPIGPGKVESEGEDEGMMGQGKGMEMDGFVDGLGSPRLRGGALHRE